MAKLATLLPIMTFILALVTLGVLTYLYVLSKRVDDKLAIVQKEETAESESIGEATLAAAQQAAWDAAWARRLASRPVIYYQPLYRPRYHYRRRYHHPPPEEEPVVEEPVVEEEVVA